ncbi:MAG: DUF2341 domain-containing protein [Chthoniobacter sp.]|nr:DUF2341 domain-containing protein [Chthoniobacter sp.]
MTYPAVSRSLFIRLFTWAATSLLGASGFGQGPAAPGSPGGNAMAFPGWKYSGAMTILTTPEGANLPATAEVENFPLLVRLDKDWFEFSQAKPNGEDVRLATAAGVPLAYQIEEWDAAKGRASLWVRVPKIKGNARQEIRLYWGKTDAASESKGAAVFNESNGYATVIHMSEALKDELGTVTPVDLGTTATPAMIGAGRHFVPGKGIDCGKNVTGYPFGDDPFTFEAWFRAENTDAYVIYYGRYATRLNGKTGDGNEIGVNIGSPSSLGWASDGPGGARAATAPVMGEWYYVAATYENGTSQIFVNGKLDGAQNRPKAMSVVKDVCVNIGGMRNGNYRFGGEIDEVRVSRVARSADWMKLQYENQNAMQTLVGPVMQKGTEFTLSQTAVNIAEGQSATITAKVGGAQKLFWILKRNGEETVVAVDRLAFTLPAGRVTANVSMTLQLKAVYPDGVKTKDIPVTITEDIPEPVVTLKAPAAWDGRQTIEVIPTITNLAAMKGKGAGEVKTQWSVVGGAVIKEIAPDKLILTRSQYTGRITVKAAVSNGGADTVATAVIQVTEPKVDPWVQRTPTKDEKPEDNQFYARDDKNEGTLYFNGTLDQPADAVFLKVTADGKPYKTETLKPAADKSYALTVKLKPGLIKYKVEFGTKSGATETVLHTVSNIVCGDAYIIEGQSNAEATGPNNGPNEDPPTSFNDWIRSYGNQHSGTIKGGWGNAVRTRIWGKPNYGDHQIGTWGMVLANDLVEKHRIPICIFNGSYGGTPIFQHQRNPDNHFDATGEYYKNPYKIYGGLLTRITAARLTHGIRGVLWHQGENDQGSGAPTGDYNWKSWQQYWVDMSAAWKQDFPNIQHYYIYQIWPSGCNMGGTNAGDMLLEAQRTLPSLYSNMRIMSTLGIVSKSSGRGLCHFDLEGYTQIAKLMCPVLEQDNYGLDRTKVLTAPNLRRAYYSNAAKSEITMEFDQPMIWKEECKAWIELDGKSAPISGGKVSGTSIVLQLSAPAGAKTIAYASGKTWDGKPDRLLYGANGIAALALAGVPLDTAAK